MPPNALMVKRLQERLKKQRQRAVRRKSGKLPSHLVQVTRFRSAIRWLLAFFRRQRGSIVRHIPLRELPGPAVSFTCDASLWGVSGVLYRQGQPAA